ncbi:hypothetical protein HQ585_21015 [candidate division KSB1 bacterium]|nr:hypothetical protein [candidate division KSB1 bacterium]
MCKRFGVRLSSEGADSKAAFHVKLIRGVKMYFKPGLEVKKVLTTTKFEKT